MSAAVFDYTIHLADNSLIMGHRLSEWTGFGPILEQDIAISNIALDLVGQARNFYQYAAVLKNDNATEDSLAYLRDAQEFKNLILTELPNGDWAKTILKIFFFSSYQYFLFKKLLQSTDKQLSAIAEKSLKEVTYHVRWSSEWVIRLGDGTPESHSRIEKALDELWDHTNEMFLVSSFELLVLGAGIGVDPSSLKDDWFNKVSAVFDEATLSFPAIKKGEMVYNCKEGNHTEHLATILKDMQYLQRTYPGCEW